MPTPATPRADFLVVGAGIAGASVAYELAAHGSVIVLEREHLPGYHATGRSAATFNESYGHPLIRMLARGSRAFFEAPPEGFTEHPLLSPRGQLLIAHRDQLRLLDEKNVELAGGVTRLSPEEVCRHVPALRRDWLGGGLFDQASRDIDVHALHQGFLRGAKARGATVLTDAGLSELSRENAGWLAVTPRGEFRGSMLINAAGAWGDEIARMAGVPALGLVAKRRTAFIFAAPDRTDVTGWPMVIDVEERFYFKPEGQRLLASPANQDPVPPHDVRPEELEIALGVERLGACSTLSVQHIYSKWAGLRTFAPGRGMIAALAPAATGFFWFVGQGGSGIKIAPAAARLAAGLIVHGAIPADLERLGIDSSMLVTEQWLT